MLVKDGEEGAAVSGVNIFWWLAIAQPRCVHVEVGLSPFEGQGGFRFLGEGGGENGEDTGVPV